MRLMRAAGLVVAEAHQAAAERIRPGVTTREVDAAVAEVFQKHSAEPLFLNFPGKVPFPAVTCTSLNEQVVHGIPGDTVLKDGDILSLDTGCRIAGWCADSAWTYPVGDVDAGKLRLMEIGRELLRVSIVGLAECQVWSEVAARMEALAHSAGFSLVEQFVGHAIGRQMHEPPQVPNFVDRAASEDFEIRPGLVLAIEPMLNAGVAGVKILDDHWTAVTEDGRPSVHFEHTIAVTSDGPRLITAGVGGAEGLLGFEALS
jgi:methionyl aminopeptidase